MKKLLKITVLLLISSCMIMTSCKSESDDSEPQTEQNSSNDTNKGKEEKEATKESKENKEETKNNEEEKSSETEKNSENEAEKKLPNQHYVYFDANAEYGGYGEMKPQLFEEGVSQQLMPNCFYNSNSGNYHFIGWSTNKDGIWEYDNCEEFLIGESDITLYALWVPQFTHKIIYHLDGGVNSELNPIYFKSQDATNPAETRYTYDFYKPTKPGYIFQGWYLYDDFSYNIWNILFQDNDEKNYQLWLYDYDWNFYAKWIDALSISDLRATARSKAVILEWKNPEVDVPFKNVIEYDGKTVEIPSTEYGAGTYVQKEIANLTSGKSYTFTIKTIDDAGNERSEQEITKVALFPNPDYSNIPSVPENHAGNRDFASIYEPLPHLCFTSEAIGSLFTFEAKYSDGSYYGYDNSLCYWYKWNPQTNKWDDWNEGNFSSFEEGGDGRFADIYIHGGTEYFCYAIYTDQAWLDNYDYDTWKITSNTSAIYSTVFVIECATERSEKIGYIAYDDGTCSFDYEEGKTPIGIVSQTDFDGKPNRIVSLEEKTLFFASDDTILHKQMERFRDFDHPLDYSDGSLNWDIICNVYPSDHDVGKYPAFDYCNSLTMGGKPWYLPSRDELLQVGGNYVKINQGIQKLLDYGIEATQISHIKAVPMFEFLSSSENYSDRCPQHIVVISGNGFDNLNNTGFANTNDEFPVRAVTKF